MNFLSNEERAELKAQHKQERDKRICDRIKAILLYDKGWSYVEIADALLLSEDVIRQHLNDYKSSKKLKPESGGSSEKLSDKQAQKLQTHLEQYTYLYVKDIVFYVQSTWNIVYTIHGMRNWLQRHGFSYKKPSLVPGKANKEQQIEWIAAYTELKKVFQKMKQSVLWMAYILPIMYKQLMDGLREALEKKFHLIQKDQDLIFQVL
jgi:transposase